MNYLNLMLAILLQAVPFPFLAVLFIYFVRGMFIQNGPYCLILSLDYMTKS
uniref:Uncharacterized protein n=1 Tax=Rhizophora mucronata TaxID=61149 RepID=A0A2P2QYY9_RHIMU